MSTRFPMRRIQPAPAAGVELRVHEAATEPGDAGGLAWVRWLFQSVRAQRTALVFQTSAAERIQALEDWRNFAEQIFLPKIAPVLLRGWKFANGGNDAALPALDHELHSGLSPETATRSIAAGTILLEQTRGAKYQAALGRYRARVDGGESPGHLAVAWSAVAALFQLPPLDLLAEYLREEWITATQHCPHHEEPQGPLGFSGLTHRALHEAGVLSFGGDPASETVTSQTSDPLRL